MKNAMRWIALVLLMTLFVGGACAEDYVTIAELREQAEQGWTKGMVLIPSAEKLPVATVQTDSSAQETPLDLTVGAFDESASGRFVNSVRHGKTPSHTTLKNSLTLEEAQAILNDELNRLVNKSIDDYGLIWTEIAEWKHMETWLLYYGQRFFNFTCFNASLTMDVRTQQYHHVIVPHYEVKDIVYDDVPLAAWSVIMESVEKYLSTHKRGTPETLELGYLMQENGSEYLLTPVWHLGLTVSNGFEEVYFSVQTGEEIPWSGSAYRLPSPFGW